MPQWTHYKATHSDSFVYCPPIFKNWWGKFSFFIFHFFHFLTQKNVFNNTSGQLPLIPSYNLGLKATGRHLDRSIDSHGWLSPRFSVSRFSVEECVHVFELPGVLGSLCLPRKWHETSISMTPYWIHMSNYFVTHIWQYGKVNCLKESGHLGVTHIFLYFYIKWRHSYPSLYIPSLPRPYFTTSTHAWGENERITWSGQMATNKMAMYYHMQMFLCWGKTSGQSKCFILVLMSQICITTSTFENSSAFTPIQNPKWRRHTPLNGSTLD